MSKKKPSAVSRGVFLVVRWLVRLFYGKCEVIGWENLPERDAVIAANHAQMNGPIVGELFLPPNCITWCAGQMMTMREVPAYAYADFWSKKPQWCRPFYRLLSYIIAPLAACIFTNARTVAVWRDTRIVTTFRETVRLLAEGKNMLIFPECEELCNNIIYRLQENFIDTARLYYRKTGVSLTFVPMYIAPCLRKMVIGKGIVFDGANDITAERHRIAEYLANGITELARTLPEHTVVPFKNIPKKNYLTNKDIDKLPKWE